MSARTLQGNTVLKYLAQFPSHPSKTIARMLFDREKPLFDDVEKARHLIRYYRGNNGAESLKKSQKSSAFIRPNGSQSDSLELLPEPIKELKPWGAEPVAFKRALLLPDMHVPFHDKANIITALRYGKKQECDAVVILGDLMDFYAVSSFDRDPRQRNLEVEIETGKACLEVLRDQFPKAAIYYVIGNHEERLTRYCLAQCPELFSVKNPDGRDMLNIGTLLDCEEYRVRVIEDRRPLLVGGKLYLLHGHEFGKGFAQIVSPARTLYNKSHANAVCAHHHQTSQHSETGIDSVVSCWSLGALCGMHPAYARLNKWTPGFGIVDMSGADWAVLSHKIINGNVV